ncbi:hypothetical protein BgiBS90_017554, partial [Biomphalaria glabrata]
PKSCPAAHLPISDLVVQTQAWHVINTGQVDTDLWVTGSGRRQFCSRAQVDVLNMTSRWSVINQPLVPL